MTRKRLTKAERLQNLRRELEAWDVTVNEYREAVYDARDQLCKMVSKRDTCQAKINKLDPPPPLDPNSFAGQLEQRAKEVFTEQYEQTAPLWKRLFGK